MKKHLLIILLFIAILGRAQDIHFSQFGILTSYQNPAYTGQFDHDYRFAAIHRNQWRSVSTPYSTFGLSAEKQRFKKVPVSLGLTLINDISGTSNFTTNRMIIPLAFHLPVKDSSFQVSFGISPELFQQSFSLQSLTFGDQFSNNQINTNNPTGENFGSLSGLKPNLSSGISLQKSFPNKHRLRLGFAYHNILNPKPIESMTIGAPPKFNISADYQLPLNSTWSFTPSFLYSSQALFSETLFGLNAQYTLKKNKYQHQALIIGGYARLQDALYPFVGLQYNEWTFGFSYDVNTSGFTSATGYRGAYEVSIVYVFDVFDEEFYRFKSCPTFL